MVYVYKASMVPLLYWGGHSENSPWRRDAMQSRAPMSSEATLRIYSWRNTQCSLLCQCVRRMPQHDRGAQRELPFQQARIRFCTDTAGALISDVDMCLLWGTTGDKKKWHAINTGIPTSVYMVEFEISGFPSIIFHGRARVLTLFGSMTICIPRI